MSDLAPCVHCNRHVVPSATVCPFCAQRLEGNLAWRGRAGVVAAAAAVALLGAAGCPTPTAAVYGGPPIKESPREPDAAASVPAPSGDIYGAPPVQDSPRAPTEAPDAGPKREHSTIYGAPPVMRR